MSDPFQQFGGTADNSTDPFQEFGGKVAESKPTESDPFAQFGGTSVINDPDIDPEYRKVRNVIERPFLSAPLIGTEITSDSELDAIARHHGVDPNKLKESASFFGARRENEEIGQEALSSLSRGPGFGIPQFVSKKLEEDPKYRAALDDVRELADSKRSMIQAGAEMLIPGGTVAKLGKGVKGAALGGAATGAIYGATGSSEGNELTGAALGAGLGTGLGAAGGYLERTLANRAKLNPLEEQISRNQQFDLNKGVEEVAGRTSKSEKIMEEVGLGNRESLSQDEVEALIEEQLGREQYNKYLNPATEEGQLIREQAGITDKAIKEKLADEILTERTRDFAEDLTGKKPKTAEQAMEDISYFSSRQGNEATVNRYREFVKEQQAEKYTRENGLRAINQPTFFGKALDFISDNQFVQRHIDDKYGRNLEKITSDLNRDFNRSTYALGDFRNKYDKLYQTNKKLGTDSEIVNSDRIYNALDTGDLTSLSQKEAETVTGFKDYFNNILGFVNGLVKEKDPRIAPLSIPARENYVPKMTLPIQDLLPIIERKVEQAKSELSAQLGREVRDLGQLKGDEFSIASQNSTVKELIDAVKLSDNKEVNSGLDLSNRLRDMLYTRDGNIGLETQARAVMERSGQIPDFMLEKNLYKLARRYTDNTIRHLYLRNGIDKLRYEARSLRKAGAEVESRYVENLVKDLLGVRKGTAAEATMLAKVSASRSLDRMINHVGRDSVRGSILTTAKAIPEMMYALTRQIYPNVLGYMNIRAIIQNATQGISKTAPELGGVYGYSTLVRGALYTVANMNKLLDKAKNIGSIPEEFTRKGERAIADGIRRSSLYQLPASVIDAAGKAGMVAYQKMESFNRALTVGIAEIMASDLARGSKLADKSLSKFPKSIQKEVTRNINNPEITSQLLSKYLNDTTQYNYNKISMSEFGRTMGPFFSVFSKWPTATAGDIIYEMRDRGLFKSLPRNAEKYLAPFLLLQSMDYILGERMGDKDSLSDRSKKLLGSNGLSQSAPIGSLGGIVRGEIFTPPAVDALMKTFIVPAMEGDPAKFQRGAQSMAKSFIPGAGLYRFLTEDLATYATGHNPKND